MPSLFDADYAVGAVPNLLARFGTAVTYTPAAGDAVSLTGIVSARRTDLLETDDGERVYKRLSVAIATDPDGPFGGVASPTLRDRMTVNGVVYDVEEGAEQTASTVVVPLVLAGSHEKSRAGYRRR